MINNTDFENHWFVPGDIKPIQIGELLEYIVSK